MPSFGSGFRVQGSGFKVQGSGGGFAAFLEDAILVSQPSPSRGRCPAGADRVTMVRKAAGSTGKERRICAANESTRAPLMRSPLPHAGKAYMVAALPLFLLGDARSVFS